jgi:hypothetical protein
MAEALLTIHGIIFLGILLFFQSILIFWAWRTDGSAAMVLLVGFLPPVGLSWILYRHRRRMKDNHIAGAVTYLLLLVGAFGFLLWYPRAMEDDIPWALIHTMQFFSFLGLANLVLSPTRESDEPHGWITPEKDEEEMVPGPPPGPMAG